MLPADKPDANEPNDHPENPANPAPTPDDTAKQLLDQITPSTAVSVTTPAYVADRAVYELVLAPHAADSTIDHVDIAVDAANGMPLQLQVVPKGQSKPAVELGFTSIDYGKPAGSFSFTPPPGSKVTTKDLTKPDTHEAAPQNAPVKGAGGGTIYTSGFGVFGTAYLTPNTQYANPGRAGTIIARFQF